MPTLTVGPTSTYQTIALAMAAAGPGDLVLLEAGYSNEAADVTVNDLSFSGGAGSVAIVLQLGSGIVTTTLLGTATFEVRDGSDANSIAGNDGANIFRVSSGVDSVTGGGGTDRLVVSYATAIGPITGTATGVTDGGSHAVTFSGVENFTITTGSGNDTLTVADGANVLNTGAGNDTVTAGNGINLIIGGIGNDTVTVGDGANTIEGGDGNETIIAGDGGNTVSGGNGDDGITTGSGNDTVDAGLGDDTVITGAGADVITVNGGVDTVDSGSGPDRLIVNYAASTTDVTGGVTGGTFLAGHDGAIANGAGTSSVVFENVERFSVTTGSGDDRITTGGGSDIVRGNAGDDRIDAAGGNDTLLGGSGADTLDGGTGNDSMAGGLGDDGYVVDAALDVVDEMGGDGRDSVTASISYTLTAGVENLTLIAGAVDGVGNGLDNRILGNGLANSLTGWGGDDTLEGGNGDDTLLGGAGTDGLLGGFGNDSLDGSDGNDTLDGGIGDDTVAGGLGDDTFLVNAAGDTLSDTGGTDTVLASVNWTLATGFENLTLTNPAVSGTGNTGSNHIVGGTGANVLSGGGGADTILGGAGADTLNGGGGADLLRGGTGNDTYFVDNTGDVVDETGGDGVDSVSASISFTLGGGVERLTLTGAGNTNGTGGMDANRIVGNAGANLISGGGGADTLYGGVGSDTLIGGMGADRLYGDAGTDTLRYGTAAEGGDTAYGFAPADDGIEVSAAGFGGGLTVGVLSAGEFEANTTGAATSVTTRFVYETDTGRLYYDEDGSGADASALLATLVGRPLLTMADISIIA